MAIRRVATPEGAKYYGVPIGTPITASLKKAMERIKGPEPAQATSRSKALAQQKKSDDTNSRGVSKYSYEWNATKLAEARSAINNDPIALPAVLQLMTDLDKGEKRLRAQAQAEQNNQWTSTRDTFAPYNMDPSSLDRPDESANDLAVADRMATARRQLADVYQLGGKSEATAGSPAAGRLPGVRTDMANLAARVTEDGFSIHPITGQSPTTGFMVSLPPEYGRVIPLSDFTSERGPQIVADYLMQVRQYLNDNAVLGGTRLPEGDQTSELNIYAGAWVQDGQVFLDTSQQVDSRQDAVTLGKRRNQIAIYDVVAGQSIEVGGTGGIGSGDKEAPSGGAEPEAARAGPESSAGSGPEREADQPVPTGQSGADVRSGDSGRRSEDRGDDSGAGGDSPSGEGSASSAEVEPRSSSVLPNRLGMGDGVRVGDRDFADMEKGSGGGHLLGRLASGEPIFTAERQKFHDDLVETLLAGIEPSGEQPHAVMLGGGPASGKSHALKAGSLTEVPDKQHAVFINPDDIKELIPEAAEKLKNLKAGADPKGPDGDWANFAHEESSYIAKRVQKAAAERGLDIVLDGTGDTSESSVSKKVAKLRELGYRVDARYVTVPTEVALQRAEVRRQKTGRMVRPSVLRNTHASVSQVLPAVADLFDSAELVDAEGDPKLIAHWINGQLQVDDQEKWDAFLAKASDTVEEVAA